MKSNEDLGNEIREFLSTVGYPEHYVPSMKELAQHGRKDLAHMVRQRGYKLIRQILESSTTTNLIKSDIEMDETGKLKMLGRSEDEIYAGKGEKSTESEDEHEVQNSSSDQRNNNLLIHCSSNGEILNGNSMNSYVSKEEQTPVNHKNDLEDEKLKAENLAEVNRLKFMLHQKELELDQLKQQIEKEKAALSVLQNNAEIEINRAQKLISKKETELYAAEGSLSGLKEVEVKYTGYGEIVELAGSFNGWHHKIKMDSQSSSIGVGPTETRKSQLWRTVLWLYPGVYEIKFVVDGDWRIDPSMESVTRGTLHNNILKVDR